MLLTAEECYARPVVHFDGKWRACLAAPLTQRRALPILEWIILREMKIRDSKHAFAPSG